MYRALRIALLPLVFLLLCSALPASTPGVFRGVLVKHNASEANWIYVQAINGTLRRVEVSKAQVVYSDSVPAPQRQAVPRSALKEGAEVRVTATPQGDDWKADRIEILNLHAKPVLDVPRLSDRSPVHLATKP